MNKIKAYLYTIECIDENYCEFKTDNKIYLNKDNAIRTLKEDVEAFIKCNGPERNGYDYTIKAEDGTSVRFQREYNSATHFCSHTSFDIQEIELEEGEDISFINELFEQEGTPMFSAKDFIKEEVSDMFQALTDKDPVNYDDMIEAIATATMDDDRFWDDFNSNLQNIMQENPDYEKLAEEYEEQIAFTGGF